jgi:putative membrane protein insertion efficiency factor
MLPFTAIAVMVIKLYQWTISPLLPRCCRFEPTCSHYAVNAILQHGFLKGCCLTVWRLLRCQPWCKSGYDPVPPRGKWRND